MKTLYLDLSMGAAGDMLSAALLELFADPAEIVGKLNAVGIPGIVYQAQRAVKCGVTGTHMRVLVNGREESPLPDGHAHTHDNDHDHDHAHDHDHDHGHGHKYDHDHGQEDGHAHGHIHTSLGDVRRLIDSLSALPASVKADAMAVYMLIAEAESQVHGSPVDEIHFHEVGTMDAVADVTAVCYLLHLLRPEKICASPVHVGYGTVRCAHGVLPVPAPATALLLTGIPTYGGEVRGELCTPTGAALLRHFVTQFGPQPLMTTQKIGYGMGTKDFERVNCVRALWGDCDDAGADTITELNCNVDDMTAEALSFAAERLFEAGAREVYFVPVTMKKSRPGTLLKIICDEARKAALVRAVFRYTTTIGMREVPMRRYVLSREAVTEDSVFGPVRKKISRGFGVTKEKYEYDDLSRIAKTECMTLDDVRKRLEKTKEDE